VSIIVYETVSGTVAGIAQEDTYPYDHYPTGTYAFFDFSDADNPGLFETIVAERERYTVVGGALLLDGAPTGVLPGGDEFALARQTFVRLTQMLSDQTTLIAAWDGMTTNQKNAWLQSNFDEVIRNQRRLTYLLRWLVKRLASNWLE
jgi:hypothetical protein